MLLRCGISNLRNTKGFTLIELMVVMAISTIVIGAGVYTFVRQDKLLRNEQTGTSLRAMGRNGLNELAKEIRRAGYGMPRGVGLYYACPTSIHFWSNTEDITTTVVADVANGATVMDVVGTTIGTQFATGTGHSGHLMLRDVQDYNNWRMMGYSSSNGDTVTSSIAADKEFKAERGITLSKALKHQFDYNATTDVIYFRIDNATQIPIISQVNSILYQYYTSAGTEAFTTCQTNGWETSTSNAYGSKTIQTVRKVKITMTMKDPKEDLQLEFTTDVNLRNMS